MARPDIRALMGMLRAASATMAQAEAVFRETGSGMRASEWDLLVTLYAFGPARPAELVRRAPMAVNAPTVHAILGRLEGRELITREAHPEQARGVLVRLTESGIEATERLFPVIERKVINGFSGHFGPDELDDIAELMERV